jgi:acyl-CoA ligase (AMP-forming) (exosortase A-associated)
MLESTCVHELISITAKRQPFATALIFEDTKLNYKDLDSQVTAFASGLMRKGLKRGDRVGIYLEKCMETVISCFGTALAGCVFVPINPLLKPEQVAYIMGDCNIAFLVTTFERLQSLCFVLNRSKERLTIATLGTPKNRLEIPMIRGAELMNWNQLLDGHYRAGHRVIDTDMAAILYTSGSTGKPKGVVLSHRNMVVGAKSVSSYLENNAQDTLLAVLPLSFDAGFSQLTTAFHVGASVVLLNYLMPRDVLKAMLKAHVTGLTAVPPLYIQLAQLEWPSELSQSLRYFANTGGRMPLEVLTKLRAHFPGAKPYLMYGLTESFRSTYLPPEEIDRRPDSIGKAIPSAEIWVMREDGTACDANEPGELVHRGALVSLGYWNDPLKTAERFKLLSPNFPGGSAGLQLPEYVVHSGDTVRQDADGFLYFIGRKDEMIKVSGYRISPSEVEEALYATQMVGECIAFAVDHPANGSAIQVIATLLHEITPRAKLDITYECRLRLPTYMVPSGIHFVEGPLPRNPNGKIDRKRLIAEWREPPHLSRELVAVQNVSEINS